ncbi:GerAB/ArcD/ProY family transporter [Paenibacillus sp. J22TS3]|uniref:GerAB/ArcD/ProY family transporter n=1 Tax=Paenibacillus sp. J22TS3 TaxID=2807192 RepID=UPI001B2D99A6|nr:GerAB/ArcD/ProY family transporter [Paenibacillus sp. J22TS3]GIP20987.1 germination protein [Paenibacillus sp. J22TS3]
MTHKEKMISRDQLFLFIIQAQIGVGVLSLPYKLNNSAKGGGGLSVLIAGMITQMIIILMWAIMKKFPGLSLYNICLKLFGKFIGRIFIIAYIGYFVLLGANIMLSAVEVLHRWLLQSTPRWVSLALFSAMTLYLAREKLTVLARFYTLATFLFIPLILLISYGLTQAHMEYMFPLMEKGIVNIIKGARETTISMYGFELMLIIYPFSQGTDKQKLLSISLANLFVTLFYVFVVATCLTVFNSEQLKYIPEPVIYLMKSLNFYIVDRADILFLPIWAITLVCSIVSYCYGAAVGMSVLFGKKEHTPFSPLVKVLTFSIALAPMTPAAVHKLDKISEYTAYLFLAGLPLIIYIFSLFMSKKTGDPA